MVAVGTALGGDLVTAAIGDGTGEFPGVILTTDPTGAGAGVAHTTILTGTGMAEITGAVIHIGVAILTGADTDTITGDGTDITTITVDIRLPAA